MNSNSTEPLQIDKPQDINASRVHPRERLKRAPLKGILVFFSTLILAGIFRSAVLMVFCIVGWSAFLLIYVGLEVKKKVEKK